MARKRTGLRNRHRSGRSTYSAQNKCRQADMYGEYQNGRQLKNDVIASHVLPQHKSLAAQQV